MDILIIYFIGMNLISLILMAIDKRKARINRAGRRKRRIPEKNLLALAFVGGAVGTYLGMKLYRHKTRHASFVYLVPLFLGLHLVALVIYLVMF